MKTHKYLRLACDKGYRILEGGQIASPSGATVQGRLHGGYRQFTIHLSRDCGKKKTTTVFAHRLAAYQKFGEAIFGPGIQVRHLNGISTDNRLCNIAIGTASDNNADKPREVRFTAAWKASREVLKYDRDKVREMVEAGMSYNSIRAALGISSKGTVSYIVRKSLGIQPARKKKASALT